MIKEDTKSFLEWTSTHWVMISTITSFILTSIGVIATSSFYEQFGINYIELAELSDFARHTVSQRYVVAFAIFTAATISLIFFVLIKMDKKYYSIKKLNSVKNIRFKWWKTLLLVFLQFLFAFTISVIYAFFAALMIQADSDYRNKTMSAIINVPAVQEKDSLTCVHYLGRIGSNHIFHDRMSKVFVKSVSTVGDIIYIDTLHKNRPKFKNNGTEFTDEYIKWQEKIKKACGDDYFGKEVIPTKKS